MTVISEVGTRTSRGVRTRTYRERGARTFRERAQGYRDRWHLSLADIYTKLKTLFKFTSTLVAIFKTL